MKVSPSQQAQIDFHVQGVSKAHVFSVKVAGVSGLSFYVNTLQSIIRGVADQYVTNAPGGATVPTIPTEMDNVNAATIPEIRGLATALERNLGAAINMENCQHLYPMFLSRCRPAENVQVANTEGSQVSDLSAGSAPHADNQGRGAYGRFVNQGRN